MTRKRLKSDQRRQQILTIALNLFARHGFAGTTTAMIAAEAGVTEPVLYQHFSNKQDLFYRLLEQVSQQTLERWQNLLKEKVSPKEKILKLAHDLPKFLDEIVLQNMVINRAIAGSYEDKEMNRILINHYKKYADFISQLIKEGIEQKEFKKTLNIQVATWQLMGPGLAYTSTQGLSLDAKIKKKVFKETIQVIINSWCC